MGHFELYKVGCVFSMMRNPEEMTIERTHSTLLSKTYIILSGFEFKVWFFISSFVLILKTLSTRLFFSIKTGWTSFDRTPIPAKIKFCLLDRHGWQWGYVDDAAHWYKLKGLPHRIPAVKLEIPGKSIFEIWNQNFCYIQVIVFDLGSLRSKTITKA